MITILIGLATLRTVSSWVKIPAGIHFADGRQRGFSRFKIEKSLKKTEGEIIKVAKEEAWKHCAEPGSRIPTPEEWGVAFGSKGFEFGEAEWTRSTIDGEWVVRGGTEPPFIFDDLPTLAAVRCVKLLPYPWE